MTVRNASRLRRACVVLVKLTVLVLLVGGALVLIRELDAADLVTLVAGSDPWLLAAAFGLLMLRPVAWAARWRLAAARRDRPPGRRWALGAVVAATAVDHVAPAARLLGAMLRARWLARGGHPSAGRALGPILYEQISHDLVMAVATIAGLTALPMMLGYWWPGLAIAIAGVVFVITVWRLVRVRGDRLAEAAITRLTAGMNRAQRRVAGVLGLAGEALDELRQLAPDRPLAARCVAFACLILVLDVAAQLLVFEALGFRVGVGAVLVTIVLGRTAGAIAGTPGGLGATEAAMTACLVLLGVPALEASAGTLLLRALHLLAVFAAGLPALAVFEFGRPPRPWPLQVKPAASMTSRSSSASTSSDTARGPAR